MSYDERIKADIQPILAEFGATRAMRRFAAADFTVAHYASALREVFHHARENPQLQALATVRFRGRQRAMVKAFYKHASQEIGHDQLALDDLAALALPSVDLARVPSDWPLPQTSALLGFAFRQIEHLNHVTYLGYLYFLEAMPVQGGAAIAANLARIGIPEAAMHFLRDHSTIDVAHTKLMDLYVRGLVEDDDDYACVLYGMRATAFLYAAMLEGAFERVDGGLDFGSSPNELRPTGRLGAR